MSTFPFFFLLEAEDIWFFYLKKKKANNLPNSISFDGGVDSE